MKLQSVHDGTVYATEGRRVYREVRDPGAARESTPASGESDVRTAGDLTFEAVGRLPLAASGLGAVSERFQTTYPWKRLVESVVGSYQTVNLWAFSHSALLATTGRAVFVSRDGGRTWHRRLTLPPSSIRMGVLPSGVCRQDGVTYLGEYPLAEDATPRVLRSTDDGWTWEVALELPGVRHVHGVAADPYDGSVWVTTGDRDAACRLLRLRDGEVALVGGGSQDWRIVEPAFTREAVVWGVDCGYAGRNRIFELRRTEIERAVADASGSGTATAVADGTGAGGTSTPDSESLADRGATPEAVGSVDSSVYYAATLTVDGTEWVALSTAAERGTDRTGPAGEPLRDRTASVVAAAADSRFTDWTTVARYRRRTALTDRVGGGGRLPSANAYVLLAADPDRGLLCNPWNTAADDGRIRTVPPSALAA